MVSIPKNPFTPERQEQLKDDALEFLETFSKAYLKSFGFALYESVVEELNSDEEPKRLKYRDWEDVERADPFHGYIYCKSGNGPGTWGKWQKVYIAERQDYKIDIFKTDKEFTGKKKPKNTITPAGYKLVKYVPEHYKSALAEIAPDLGMTDSEMDDLSTLSPYAWAMFHPLRPNFVFQMHKGKDAAGCLCLGGGSAVEPEGAGSEEAKDKDGYIDCFQRCVNKCRVRDLDSVKGKAFDRTVNEMVEKLDNLTYFQDDGTESEILTDMLIKQCLTSLQKDMLQDLAVLPAALKITMWMKARAMVQAAMVKIVTPAWETMDGATDQLLIKIEPTLRQGITKFVEAKQKMTDKVKSAVTDKIGGALATHVNPYLKKIFQSFEKPVNEAFVIQKTIYQEQVPDIETLSIDEKVRNMELDSIPRSRTTTSDMLSSIDKLIDPLHTVKGLHDIFDFLEPEVYRGQAEDALLKVLDAAIYTLELRVTEEGRNNEIKGQVLKDWEHDSQIAKANFLCDAMKAIILGGVKKALSNVVDPILDPIDETIPEDVRDVISARALYDEIVDLMIGEPIVIMVRKAYPGPQ